MDLFCPLDPIEKPPPIGHCPCPAAFRSGGLECFRSSAGSNPRTPNLSSAVHNSVHNPVDIAVDNFVDRAVESGKMRSALLVATRDLDRPENGEPLPVSRETFTDTALCRIFLPKRRKTRESGDFGGQSPLSPAHNQQPSQSPQFVTPATLVNGWLEDANMSRITESGLHR